MSNKFMDGDRKFNLYLVSVNCNCGSETDVVRLSSSLGNWLILLNDSGYSFVNECTIRIKESNVLLNIINKTADWIAAFNTTNLFTIHVTSNNSDIFTALKSHPMTGT